MTPCLSNPTHLSCTKCSLSGYRTKVVPGHGKRDASIFFIAEAPGKDEDEVGEPLVGAAGEIFDRCLEQAGLTRGEVFATNMLHCRPPHNDIKHQAAVEGLGVCPQLWLAKEIEEVNPKILVVMGGTASVPYFPGKTVGESSKLARVIGGSDGGVGSVDDNNTVRDSNAGGDSYKHNRGRIVLGCYHPAYAFEFRGGEAVAQQIVGVFSRARRLAGE